ncbi:hypothetical protein Tco_0345263 [Tanacetum coccineum]
MCAVDVARPSLDFSNTNQWGKKEAGSSPPSSGKWAAVEKLMMRVGPLVLSRMEKLLGQEETKKINVHPEWKDSSHTNHWLSKTKSGTPRSQSGCKTSFGSKKDDKEDQCASRVEDSSNTNQWGKRKLDHLLLHLVNGLLWKTNDESGPPRLHLDGKLLGPRRMTKKINVHPEWKILQTLTNGAKRKLDHLLLHLINVHPEWKILQTLTNGAKRKLDHLLLHLVNGLLWKTNDESGTPRSQSGWKTSWAKKDDKEDQCASRVEDSSNTNQMGQKGSWIISSFNREMGVLWKTNDRWDPLVLSLDGKLLGPRRMTKKINVHPSGRFFQTLTNELWMGI